MPLIFAGIASFIHYYTFALESLLWGRPKTQKVFQMNAEESKANKKFAFNQGFYNLFLAVGSTLGVILSNGEQAMVGQTLVIFTMASMLGASLVLIYSDAKLIKPALIQGLPPFLALTTMFLF